MGLLNLDALHVAAMRDHAEVAYPRECCGALLGKVEDDGCRVVAIERMGNRREDTAAETRFLISADDYRRLEARAGAASLDILGFYHSHPDHPAEPSDYDREHALPWLTYVIISVESGRATNVKGWTLRDDRSEFVEENIT